MKPFTLGLTSTALMFFFAFLVAQLMLYRNVLIAEDIYRIPKRFFTKVFMTEENLAVTQLREYSKLREFLNRMDIPLKEKQYIIWDIERAEKNAVQSLSDSLKNDLLKKRSGSVLSNKSFFRI